MLCYFIDAMENLLKRSIKYGKGRVVGGEPIAQHQIIQHELADMKILFESSRFLDYNVAWKKQEGSTTMMDACIAKAFCADAWFKVAEETIRIHGGRGYLREYELERGIRDAMFSLLKKLLVHQR